jgi:hypothetical protein
LQVLHTIVCAQTIKRISLNVTNVNDAAMAYPVNEGRVTLRVVHVCAM